MNESVAKGLDNNFELIFQFGHVGARAINLFFYATLP